jgi:hypothetical protein
MAYTTIDKSTLFQNNVLYNGDGTAIGSGGNVITGVGFSADMTWLKERSSTSGHHLFDTARGATKKITPDSTAVEATNAETLASWQSDGFTVGDAGGANESGQTYVAWNWKMGTTSGLSGGTITPSAYSINTTAKQGVYAYSGTATLLIIKALTGTNPWAVWQKDLAATEGFVLNTNAAKATGLTNILNSTTPTDTLISLGTDGQSNGSGIDYILYAFCDVKGYAKTSTYKGTGQNTQGQFIYTGFRPSFVLIKNWAGSEDWHLYDNKREYSGNLANKTLDPNTTAAEYTISDGLDLYSNGFRTWTSASALNTAGQEYLYAAFGQSMVGSNGIIGTAR